MKLRCGVIGLRRGKLFVDAFAANEHCDVVAVCDPAANTFDGLSGLKTFTETGPFLDEGLDVVAVISPGPVHAEQSLAALDSGAHVLTETPCVYSVDEAECVVRVVGRTGRRYMLAENYLWMGWCLALKRLAEEGKFGQVVYAEGDYTHDCRNLMLYDEDGKVKYAERDGHPDAKKAWRATDLPPLVYCSHTLGPILHLMGDRVVSAVGLGVHDRGMPGIVPTDIESALFETANGAVIRLTNGFTLAHPYTMYYSLVGTKGSAKMLMAGDMRVKWYSDLEPGMTGWQDLDLAWGSRPDDRTNERAMVDDFVAAVVNDTPLPLDVHASMDMQLPGIIAHGSAQQAGAKLPVPDSRAWR